MGDAFRGLTIKIGADARPLQSAISEITRSASAAQRQFNAMQKALKFNPANSKALQSSLDLIGDKALHSARGATKVAMAMRQASQEVLEFSKRSGLGSQKLESMASSTREVYAATQRLRSETVSVNAQLAHIYEAMARVRADAHNISFEKALKQVKTLASHMYDAEGHTTKAYYAVQKLARQAAMMTNVGAKFDLGNSLADASKLFGILIKNKNASRELDNDLKAMGKVEGFRAMQNKLIAFHSELRQSAVEAARLQSELYMLGTKGQLSKPLSDIKNMGSASQKAAEHARQMAETYSLIPKSAEAAKDKIISSKAVLKTYEEELKAIEGALLKIKSDPAFDIQAASSEEAYIKAQKVENEYSDLTAKLKICSASAEKWRQQLATMQANGVKETSAEFQKIRTRVVNAENAVSRFNQQLDALRSDHSAAALVMQFKELSAQQSSCIAKTEMLRAETSKLRAAMNFGTGLRELGYGLYSTLTPAIMIAGRYAIQAAADIDSAYRDMRKTVNGTEEEFEQLKDAALEFSSVHVTSADTILEIEAMGGQLGIQARNLEAFAETISNLEIATDIEAENMAKYVGQLSNIMRDIDQSNPAEYAKDLTSFSDALVRLGNNSAAQESSIMKVMMRIASLGTISGFTTPQLLAISTAVAATGQGCEAAGTAISKTFSNIESAVGSGGDSLESFAKVAGMSAEEFAAAWEGDPIEAFKAFIGGLKQIDEAGGSVDNTLKSLKINSVRQKQALEGLVNTYDVLTESLGMSQSAWEGLDYVMNDGSIERAGDAAREAQRKSEGFSGELEMMKNNAKVLASELADGAVPIITMLGDLFQQFTAAAKGMPRELKTAAVGVAGFLAAIGPLGVATGTITRSIASVIQFVGNMQGKMIAAGESLYWMAGSMTNSAGKLGAASKAVSGLGKALQFLGSTGGMLAVAGVATAIGLIVNAIQDAIKKSEDFKKATDGVHSATTRAIGVLSTATGKYSAISGAAGSSAKSVDELVESSIKLADSMEERAKSTETEINQLRDAQRIINRYTNKDLSNNITAQGELKAAIDKVNEACGTQYQVVDLVNGKIADEKGQLLETVDAINAYITAKVKQTETDQLIADRAEMKQQLEDDAVAYAKAAKDYSDAEKRVAYARENNIQLTEDELAWIKSTEDEYRRKGDLLRSHQADYDAINDRLGAVVTSSDKATVSLDSLARADGVLRGFFGNDSVELDNFIMKLDDCGLTMADFGNINEEQWSRILAAWASGNTDMASILSDVGVKTRSLVDQYRTELSDAGGNFDDFASHARTSADLLAEALHNSGISASELSHMSIEAFDNLFKAADEDISNIGVALDLLNQLNIDPKNLIFTDEGMIDKISGKLIQLDFEADKATTPRTFRINEDGSLTEITDEVNDLDGKDVTTTVTVDDESVDDAQEDWDTYEEDVAEGAEGEATIKANTESAMRKVEEAYSYARKGETGTVTINAGGDALGVLNAIASTIRVLTAATHVINVGVNQTNAAGGIASGAIRAIPRNASGGINGIVTRATLTNVGWVGEAGDEALLHMKHAGGAIIPLSNRQHVRPFARAVAAEMGGGGTEIHNHYSIGSLEVPADTALASAMEDVFRRADRLASKGRRSA